jgi:RES domain-containing protein
MIVYRICREKYKEDISGKGAEMTGGRWNSKGYPMIYTSSSCALATAEVAVHLPLGLIPKDYFLVSIKIPENAAFSEILPENLDAGWNSFPHPDFTQKAGDEFLLKNEKLYLKVPSAVVAGDFNVLLNPMHHLMKDVKILKTEIYEFDSRLFLR